jgi:hypothetical protein
MTYQPDYTDAIRIATSTVGAQFGEAVVMALLKSGEMVCVPRAKHTQGRKTYEQLLHVDESWYHASGETRKAFWAYRRIRNG